jgi:hypothetical protein
MDNTATIIGKDVIESLTLGMYEDSRFIYREYVQNAADQIDRAVDMGLLSSRNEGRIEININKFTRTISIYDNATGIEANKVQNILKNIAQSTKERGKSKGFRGIGRLGGVGYCDRLIFETSFHGEEMKSLLTWDSKELKSIINNRNKKETAAEVIDAVTSYSMEKEDKDERYFKVTLENVSNDVLLDEKEILEYLSMVAPVSYSKGFIFKGQIYDYAKELNVNIDEYPIFINGKNQVFKNYTTSLYEGDESNKKKFDEVHSIDFITINDPSNNLIAWGWYTISTLKKQLPVVNKARGIRLRKGNIQIGLEGCLEKLFKETRGNLYFFGEVHAISPELIPNARRDYFLENKVLSKLENELKSIFDRLHKLYHFSSEIRNTKKKVDDFLDFSKEFEEKQKKGFTNIEEEKKYQTVFEEKKEKAKQAEEKLVKTKEKITDEQPAQKKVFDKVVGTENEISVEEVVIQESNGKTKFITDELSSLNRKERKLVSKIFAVIDNMLPKEIASILKEKIKEELT